MNPIARHKARRSVLQALYQWHMTQDPIADIEAQYLADEHMNRGDKTFFSELLQGVAKHRESLDEQIKPFCDRELSALDPIELAILRMATFELLHRVEIPDNVSINEAVELAKVFGAQDSYKFVNATLDKFAKHQATS